MWCNSTKEKWKRCNEWCKNYWKINYVVTSFMENTPSKGNIHSRKFPPLVEPKNSLLSWSTVHTWARWIQFTHHYHIFVRLILVLPSQLTLKSSMGYLSLGFPTKTLNAFLFSAIHVTHLTQLILLDFIILIKPGKKYSYEPQNGYTCKACITLTDIGSL